MQTSKKLKLIEEQKNSKSKINFISTPSTQIQQMSPPYPQKIVSFSSTSHKQSSFNFQNSFQQFSSKLIKLKSSEILELRNTNQIFFIKYQKKKKICNLNYPGQTLSIHPLKRQYCP
eukprot:TRINITY_DN17025_c0_g1_i1.p2 TRINITY_DN17025_c0_g1~~TRINITY_DN17025_c0_g1_i1.p2  ORF type:complete len:117 (+),score=1.70 TRINITY_DN17025_c0_g1_i1:67-417(+)